MSMPDVPAYRDASHEGNSAKYHSGKPCVEPGCQREAGTFWSPAWCFEHNVARMDRISASLADAAERAKLAALVHEATKSLRDWAADSNRTIKAMVIAAGGELTIRNEDKNREIVSESTHYGQTTTTFQVRT